MQKIERLSITLPKEMAQLIRAKVEEGGYASNSEVIREALRAWATQEDVRSLRLESIKTQIAESFADPRLSLSEAELKAHFAKRRAGM